MRQLVMTILWPAFLMAGVLEALVFVVVDPTDLRWFGGEAVGLSVEAVYTVTFLIIWLTMVGYAGGFTPNPTYRETCTQLTGHNEVVRVIYDPTLVSYEELLKVFWEGHDPTQGMRQGNDVGSTYRSGIYAYNDAQMAAAKASKEVYAAALKAAGMGAITTEIVPVPTFYFAEDYHQQYLAKNPGGYCGVGGTGVACPIGTGVRA